MTRAFAFERLHESGDCDPVAHRHAAYFTHRLARLDASPAGPADVREILGELAANVRSALERSFGPTGDADVATALAARRALFVELSLFAEGESWMRLALPLLTESPEHLRRAVAVLGVLAAALMFSAGSGPEGRESFERAIRIAEQLGDHAAALRLNGLFNVFLERTGDIEGVHATARRSLEIAKALGDPSALRVARWTSGLSAILARDRRPEADYLKALLLLAEPGGKSVAYASATIIVCEPLWSRRLACGLGFPDRAAEAALTTLEAAQAVRQPVPICVAYLNAIYISLLNGDLDRALMRVR